MSCDRRTRAGTVVKRSIDIDRSAAEAFGHPDRLERHSEWQRSLESAKVQTGGPTRVARRVVERRKVPGATRAIPYEITAHEPP
jgi:hypothetical protein